MTRVSTNLLVFLLFGAVVHICADDGTQTSRVITETSPVEYDVDVMVRSLSSIAYSVVWNVSRGSYFNLSASLEFPTYLISLPGIVGQRAHSSSFGSVAGGILDPCVHPTPFYDIVTLYFSAFSDGVPGWFEATIMSFDVDHLVDRTPSRFLCPRIATGECVRYYVIEVREPSPEFSIFLSSEFNGTVVIAGGNDACPTRPRPGGVHITQDIKAKEEIEFKMDATDVKRLYLQITAQPHTDSTIVMSYEPITSNSSTFSALSFFSLIIVSLASFM